MTDKLFQLLYCVLMHSDEYKTILEISQQLLKPMCAHINIYATLFLFLFSVFTNIIQTLKCSKDQIRDHLALKLNFIIFICLAQYYNNSYLNGVHTWKKNKDSLGGEMSV